MKSVSDSELLTIGYRYAFALAANRQDAEDLLHDAWIRLVSRYGGSPDKPLLYRTIKNLFIDKVRHAAVVQNHVNSQLDTLSYDDPALDQLINTELLGQHLTKLKANEREILFLSVVEGYTADEISAMTGLVRGTILSLLHRTKRKLRNSISSDHELEQGLPNGKKTVGKTGNVIPLKRPVSQRRSN